MRSGDGVVMVQVATDARPHLTPARVDDLVRTLSDLADGSGVAAVVLDGGDRYFSAGASSESLTAMTEGALEPSYVCQVPRALLACPVPVIAAATGHAIGGGLLLALWCDAVVLAEESLYGANFTALGLVPGMGATHVVPEAFGPVLGRELLLTGRILTGREIRAAGCPLSHAVRRREQVREEAFRIAHDMARVPPNTLSESKQLLAAARREHLDAALRAEALARTRLLGDPDAGREIQRRYPLGLAGRDQGR